ncbi:MAG TPA: cell division protein FtsZ, partial [Candidatus Binatia bacterium]|nr:cell division protein FtsZ [Candidatus Binatia bacterium]
MIEFVENGGSGAQIRIVGIGGGGGNAINTMISAGLSGVSFIAANTDAQALRVNLAPTKAQLGANGLGAGANPEVGRRSTLESEEELRHHLVGADMVFVT